MPDRLFSAWWTEADQAEFDVLTWAFVRLIFAHRAACTVCAAPGPWCPPVSEAFEAVADWRRARSLLSRAEYLRAREAA